MPPRPSLIVLPPAPDSPRSAQSVPPTGIQGDLEQDLMGLANALYNLGTTVVNDSTKDPGTGKQVGLRVCAPALHPLPPQLLMLDVWQERSGWILGGARWHGVKSYDARADASTHRHRQWSQSDAPD